MADNDPNDPKKGSVSPLSGLSEMLGPEVTNVFKMVLNIATFSFMAKSMMQLGKMLPTLAQSLFSKGPAATPAMMPINAAQKPSMPTMKMK